jgi:UDP-N-acetylmuramoylalanine--D-glutamate ligase
MESSHSIIVGLGRTGYACARYFRANDMSFEIVDQNNHPEFMQQVVEEMPEIRITTGKGWRIDTRKVTDIVISPGVPVSNADIVRAKSAGIPVSVAITGSNGKSTVTTLVGLMAEKAGKRVKVGGNIGVPALELLDSKAELYVLELSSFQLETTYNLQAQVATILNISADHMDRYSSETEYVKAKERIFNNCEHTVLNRDEEHFDKWRNMNARTSSFGESVPSTEEETGLLCEDGATYLMSGSKKLMLVDDLKIRGKHNYLNAIASISIARVLAIPEDAMIAALKEFEGLPYRCSLVNVHDGIEIYNDSKATNVGAAIAAIAGLGEAASGRLVVIMGGVGKEADFQSLHDVVRRYVKKVVLIGRDAKQIESVVADVADTCLACDLESAFHHAMKASGPGDVVGLVPACASFDMFNNYEHRGAVFDSIVKRYLETGEMS